MLRRVSGMWVFVRKGELDLSRFGVFFFFLFGENEKGRGGGVCVFVCRG